MTTSAVLDPAIKPVFRDDEPLYEVIDGQRVELSPRGAYATTLAFQLGCFIQIHSDALRLGRATVETLFNLMALGRKRRPDVAFVSYQRWPRKRRVPTGEAWDVTPNLAVEVISPSNLAEEAIEKVAEYFRAGVELVWVVLPANEQVYVYEAANQILVLAKSDVLDGGTVLPQFRLPLSQLFASEESESSLNDHSNVGNGNA
jgi:Uma2 family endonuclease